MAVSTKDTSQGQPGRALPGCPTTLYRMRWVPFVVSALTLSLFSCSSDEPDREAGASARENLPATVVLANYELVADESTRFLAGVVLPDGRVVTGGTVQMRFAPLDSAGELSGPVSEPVTGTYLAAAQDATDEAADDAPQATSPQTAPGVYEVEGANFPSAGGWIVEIAADVANVGVIQGSQSFTVAEDSTVPALGELAPSSDNYVIGDPQVDDAEIDSRAMDGEPIPDPSLHRDSISDAVQRGRPAVVLFSTPTYCQSRFCGPVTDMVEGLAKRYPEKATFIHVEVWKDFERSVANPTAIKWLFEGDGLNEPWLFILGSDGRVQARWDNLLIEEELESAIKKL